MNTVETKNNLDVLLKQLSSERSFDIAEKITNELVGLLNIQTTDRFLVNIPRVDAELTRFQLAPGFARQAAAYELPHGDNKPFDIKLFWVKKASKTNLSWLIGLTPNFEDALSNDYKNIGIDFVVPEACDSITVLLSNRFKVRALELKDHITPTQLEIFTQWAELSNLTITDQVELKYTLHSKLWESFNFEPINRKFYLELVEHFSILVHHLEKDHDRKLSVMFTTRLIGRLLFVWFLKKKNLINTNVDYFSILDTEKQKEYYETKLEKLFFEVLNSEDLRSNGDNVTPYLNGGLFDKNTTDFYNDPKLTFPNGYFNQLFETLNKYNFTVDESSPEFQHVAIDPEMLGRIFESLLAEQIDENTGNNKKKATGAFYTPREIVSYMCEQSLMEYLKTKIPESTDRDRRIEELVTMPEAIFRDQDQNKRRDWKPYRESIIKALEGTKSESGLTVLDPAVGSGAFPMGMLHLLVKVYTRLDSKFEKDVSGLKRDILSKSLYGADIEQTAIEICRLRAWLSLIVDIPEGEKIEPLPNLEFKFVCANTLIPLDNSEQATFSTDHDLKDKLISIRDEYFKTSSKTKKEKLQNDYLTLTQNTSLFDNKKTQQLKGYKPFDISSSSEFYDPELMHGVQAFGVVVGNPPYVQVRKGIYSLFHFPYSEGKDKGKQNLYKVFVEQGYNLLQNNGICSFIVQSSLMCDISSQYTRQLLLTKTIIKEFVEFPKKSKDSSGQVFDTVLQGTCVFLFMKQAPTDTSEFAISTNNNTNTIDNLEFTYVKQKDIFEVYPSGFCIPLIKNGELEIIRRLRKRSIEFKNYIEFTEKGDINLGTDKKLVVLNDTGIKLFRGGNIQRYYFDYRGNEFILDTQKIQKRLNRNIQSEFLISQQVTGTTDKFRLHFTYFEGSKCIFGDSVRMTKTKNIDKLLILGILNSSLLDWFFRKTSTNNNVNGYEIEQLPIVNLGALKQTDEVDQVRSLVSEILFLKKQNRDADTKNLESKIDILIYRLYGLSPEEIEIVKNLSKK